MKLFKFKRGAVTTPLLSQFKITFISTRLNRRQRVILVRSPQYVSSKTELFEEYVSGSRSTEAIDADHLSVKPRIPMPRQCRSRLYCHSLSQRGGITDSL